MHHVEMAQGSDQQLHVFPSGSKSLIFRCLSNTCTTVTGPKIPSIELLVKARCPSMVCPMRQHTLLPFIRISRYLLLGHAHVLRLFVALLSRRRV